MAKMIAKINDKEIYSSDVIQVVKGVDLEKRILHITGSTEDRDRDGDVISMRGWRMENYLKNPVFLWAHDYSSVPLARTIELRQKKSPNRLDFKDQFPTKGLYPFADMILQLYHEQIINASSVGFIPYKFEEMEEKDNPDIPPHQRRGRKFLEQELLELSGCAVPSNPGALQNALKEITGATDDMVKSVMGSLAPPAPAKMDDVLGELYVHNVKVFSEERKVWQVPITLFETASFEEEDESKKLEETEGEVRYRLRDPADFEKFRYSGLKKDKPRVFAVYGKYKGKDEWAMQSLRFPKEDGWDKEKAASWIKEHPDLDKMASGDVLFVSDTLSDGVWVLIDELVELRSQVEVLTYQASLMQRSANALIQRIGFKTDEVSFKEDGEGNTEVLFPDDVEFLIGHDAIEGKIGAVLNAKNKDRLRKASDLITEVLADAEPSDDTGGKTSDPNDQGLSDEGKGPTGEEGKSSVFDEILDGEEGKEVDVSSLTASVRELIEAAKKAKK